MEAAPLGRRRRALALVAGVLLVAAGGRAAPASAALPGLVTDLTWGISSSDQDRTIAAMKDVGDRWARLSIQWKAWETSPGHYAPWEVSRTDRAVQLCHANGIRVVIDVLNAPAWASNTNDSGQGNLPRNNQDYANFMRMLAARYKGQVDAYEIWNEPDINRFWNGGPNASAYTALLKVGYSAVKSADPSALVVGGALSWDYTNYLNAMYRAGAKGSFDVLSIHPYWTGTMSGWQRSYRGARQTELANGDEKPIWITEFGFNTAKDPHGWQPGVSQQQQADLVTQAFTMLEQDPYVQVAFYYNFRNNWWSHDDATDMEAQFGLLNTDFSAKPAYYAYKKYAQGAAPQPPPPPPSPPPAPDARPAIALTAPADGTSFTNTLNFSANASDDKGVREVRFLVDGKVVATDGGSPYGLSWQAPKHLSYGSHTVLAVAVDSAGQTTSSASVSVVRVKRKKDGGRVLEIGGPAAAGTLKARTAFRHRPETRVSRARRWPPQARRFHVRRRP